MSDPRALCPACGVDLPAISGPTHAYMTASPACWALYGRVLAREYQDRAYFLAHGLTVDAYALQHSPGPDRRARQSTALHLAGLALRFGRRALGLDPAADAPRRALLARLADRPRPYPELTPPARYGVLVSDLPLEGPPTAHHAAVERYARAVFAAWAAHHAYAETLIDEAYA